MTEAELKHTLQSLTAQVEKLVEVEEQRKEIQQNSDQMILEQIKGSKTFIAKHGAKIAGVLFAGVTAGLAWYAADIRSGIQAEHRSLEVDQAIKTNSANISDLKESTTRDIRALQKDSVKQTLMMNEGFLRQEKILLKATKLNEKDLPKIPDEFEDAVKSAKELEEYVKRGYHPPAPIGKDG